MGLDKNNDPIQDYNPGALKMKEMYENLTGDEDYSGRDEDYSEEYHPDLHDCSDDLSEEGSIREEREHAKYAYKAKQKKIDELNGQGYSRNKYGNRYGTENKYGTIRVAANKVTSSIVGIYAFLIIFVVIAGMIMSVVLGEKTVYNSDSETDDYDYDYDYSPSYTIEETSMENIYTWTDNYDSTNDEIQVYVQNDNELDLSEVDILVTFYDSEYNDIYRRVLFFENVEANEKIFQTLECPEEFKGCYSEVLDYLE